MNARGQYGPQTKNDPRAGVSEQPEQPARRPPSELFLNGLMWGTIGLLAYGTVAWARDRGELRRAKRVNGGWRLE